ncbi:MAG TPA: hypothetical protein VKR55_24660 [Bradyrhizobium sp.]|uniref:hypothetical protein n=1 Tax=Bradyrhizobium sp. TaxID=376 RepID=UPI002B6AAA60|nr:hypothetical protein [Bradyrhizobium sp.]HLZ05327.1 hypothetical protein [Bradyrhizobium sp.]
MFTTENFLGSAPSCRANQSNITVIGGAFGRRQVLAFKVLQRLDLGPRGDDRSPEIKEVEEIGDLDAAQVGEADGEQRGTAAELEFTGVELCGVCVRRPFFERDRQSILLVELLCLDDRRQERAERGRTENDD